MAEPLDRENVIRLLKRLGSDQDADVLEAALDLHAQITAADLDWDELLMPDNLAEDPVAAETPEPDHAPEDSADAAPKAGKIGKNADTLALIDSLLAGSDRSEALREELAEYKADIANGDFAAKDHQYVRALYERLTK